MQMDDKTMNSRITALRAEGHFRLGCRAFANERHAPALEHFLKSAALGHAEAAFRVGSMYSRGLGTPGDRKTAVRYYRLAAERGNKAGALLMYMLCRDGVEVPRDREAALRWLEMAKERKIDSGGETH